MGTSWMLIMPGWNLKYCPDDAIAPDIKSNLPTFEKQQMCRLGWETTLSPVHPSPPSILREHLIRLPFSFTISVTLSKVWRWLDFFFVFLPTKHFHFYLMSLAVKTRHQVKIRSTKVALWKLLSKSGSVDGFCFRTI